MTSYLSTITDLRKQVFRELDKNPLLTARPLAKMLHLTENQYQYYKNYLKKLKYEWKRHHENERGSIRSSADDVHNAFYCGCLPLDVAGRVREELGRVWDRAGRERWIFPERPMSLSGWRLSRSRNRFLLYKCSLGRIRFFENGNLELYVRKPANFGKAMQLFCDALTKTGLVTDIREIELFQKSLRIRGFHAAFATDQRLPYMKVNLFKDTNGFQLILGDRTHPHSAELIIEYQDQVEQAKRLIEELGEVFGLGRNGNGKNGDARSNTGFQDYSR